MRFATKDDKSLISDPTGELPRAEIEDDDIFAIPLQDDAWLVYLPLRRTAFVANAEMVNALHAYKSGCESEFNIELRILMDHLNLRNGTAIRLPITSSEGPPRPTAITLFLTTACNLRCTYCYASAGDTPLKAMSIETAQRGIDFIIRNAVNQKKDHVEIAWHGGGEPTVNWNVLTGSYDYAVQQAGHFGIRVSASTATNGVLSDEKLDWILRHLQGASISFDGLPSVHDQNRLTLLGHGSSERVIHTMKRMDEANFVYGIRMTVTADLISQLPESVSWICSNLRPRRIQVEPAYPLGRWKGQPSAETIQFIDSYRAACRIAKGNGFDLNYSAARLDLLTNHFCGVTQDSFALSPDGNVSACYEVFSEDNPFAPVFFYGQPDTDGKTYSFNLPVLDHLRQQAVQNRDYCQGCFAKWHCAGDCYHRALADGQTEFSGTDRCHITRELIIDLLLERIASSGGVAWRGGIDDAFSAPVPLRNVEGTL